MRTSLWLQILVPLLVATPTELTQAATPAVRPPLVQKVEPEALEFSSPILKQRFDTFQAKFAMQAEGVQIEPLTLKENTSTRGSFYYYAIKRFELKPHEDIKYLQSPVRSPAREIEMILTPSSKDRSCIQKLRFRGRYVPPYNGWAALVTYELSDTGDGCREEVSISFDHNQQGLRHEWDFHVPYNSVRASYQPENAQFAFVFLVSNRDSDRVLMPLSAVASPASLRDVELRTCDALEGRLRDNVTEGRGFVLDWSRARSDRPPERRALGASGVPNLTDQDKAAVLIEGIKQLNLRRDRWKEHADEFHSAVGEAFPLLVEWAATANNDRQTTVEELTQ